MFLDQSPRLEGGSRNYSKNKVFFEPPVHGLRFPVGVELNEINWITSRFKLARLRLRYAERAYLNARKRSRTIFSPNENAAVHQ